MVRMAQKIAKNSVVVGCHFCSRYPANNIPETEHDGLMNNQRSNGGENITAITRHGVKKAAFDEWKWLEKSAKYCQIFPHAHVQHFQLR